MSWEFFPGIDLQSAAAAVGSGATVDQEFIAPMKGKLKRLNARAMAAAVASGAIVTTTVLVNGTAIPNQSTVVNNAKGTALQSAALEFNVEEGDRITIRCVESGSTATTALVGRSVVLEPAARR